MSTYRAALDAGMKLNINMVTMSGLNEEDIVPMAMLTKHDPVTVRYIEEMPFNGVGEREKGSELNYKDIIAIVKHAIPQLKELPRGIGSTSTLYQIEGHQGKIGVIPAWSRTFCSDCNRIRVTAKGEMKNCLYDGGILNLKQLLTNGASDDMIREEIRRGYSKKFKNGHEAEASRAENVSESMSTIGG